MGMVNMKTDREEAQEVTNEVAGDTPAYPYGLELRLDDKSLEKLGMAAPPAVGSVLMITARVEVTSASQHQTQDREAESSSCWQITDLEVQPAKRDAKAMYPNSKMND